MLTKEQITAASPTLDDVDIEMIATLIRNSSSYQEYPDLYPNLMDKLNEINGTVKAQQINAILDLIEALGAGEVEIKGGEEGLRYSQTIEREALINYAINVLYDKATAYINQTAAFGIAVGQRELSDITQYCPICSLPIHPGACYSSWY